MSDFFLYFLLLGAIALGWILGRLPWLGGKSNVSRPFRNLPAKDYFIGLNYLLNDEPDDAIDLFIDALEVNSSTLQTHMALGTLLRRRGKVDRSISVYQDLLGQNGFTKAELNEIKINLVQSYIAAGLLDRAEHLLEELRREKGTIKIDALVHSANVYQLEKDWQEGVNVLIELIRLCSPAKRDYYQKLASHFYCELAEAELSNEHMSRAREFLQLAAGMDKNNVRVSILRGQLENSCGNYREAIKSYLRIKKQDSAFMAEVFYPLLDCYKNDGKEKNLQKFIDTCIAEEKNTSVLLGLAEYLQKENGDQQARDFLLRQLAGKPSLRLLLQTLSLREDESNGENEGQDEKNSDAIVLYKKVLTEYIDSKAQYQCVNCGFELKSLHWQCPSCSRWGSVKHVMGILGE
ncbi:hypothetical protein N8600_06135 [Gammaproteobacteria bacterium]|nr:hypothetical protein [Gammaproteobacteria bacterium]